jgi:hypothetical protein
MSALFKRLFNGDEDAAVADWPDARRWAENAGHRFAVGRGGEGFVVESQAASSGFRIEWGPSQRNFIAGQELRVRVDLGSASDVQMLVATAPVDGAARARRVRAVHRGHRDAHR